MTIQKLHEQFCEYQAVFKGYQRTTIHGYKDSLRVLLVFNPDIQSVEDIDEIEAQRFFYWGRREREWKPSTYITYHKRLKVFYDYLKVNGIVQNNPFENIDKPKIGHRLPKGLSKDQAKQILDSALHDSGTKLFTRMRNHALYAVFLFAGLRRSEVLNLMVKDVDLTNNRISIHSGKGNKDRFVPISHTLHNILSRYVSLRSENYKYSEYFFVSSNRDERLTENGLKHVQDDMVVLVGFKFHLHQLRHTFATLMLDGGCNIYTLSQILGHSDIKTTTIYLSTSSELLKSEIFKHPLN